MNSILLFLFFHEICFPLYQKSTEVLLTVLTQKTQMKKGIVMLGSAPISQHEIPNKTQMMKF
jgi:hypothetical protein